MPSPNVRPQFERSRNSARFPIRREVFYAVRNSDNTIRRGRGESIEIGSGGIAFTAEDILNPGEKIELSVSWPALLDGRLALRLKAQGRVLRSDRFSAVCSIEKYEFRTEGAARKRAESPSQLLLGSGKAMSAAAGA